MVRLFASLTNRIFLACTLLATLSLGFAFAFVNARVTAEVEAELRRDLSEAGTLVDQRRAAFTETFTTMARLIADLPKLIAAVETGDPPTVQPLADEYQREIDADVLVLTSPERRRAGLVGLRRRPTCRRSSEDALATRWTTLAAPPTRAAAGRQRADLIGRRADRTCWAG